MKHFLFIALLPVLLLFSSCIQTPEPTVPKRIDYLFFADNVGDTLAGGQDSVSVTEIKMLADKFNVVLQDDALLQSEVDALIMSYGFEQEDAELVYSSNIGYEVDRFKGLELFIAPVNDSDNIQDNDFFGGDNNYSLIIKGTYNGRDFTYNADYSFTRNFEFSMVEVTDSEETLVLRFSLDVADIFIDETGEGIVDPDDEENRPHINAQVEETLELEAFSANRIF